METDGKEEKERTSNKGQWRPVYSQERPLLDCKWPRQAFTSAHTRETQETASCTEQTEGPRRGPQEAPSRSGPAGSVRAGRL